MRSARKILSQLSCLRMISLSKIGLATAFSFIGLLQPTPGYCEDPAIITFGSINRVEVTGFAHKNGYTFEVRGPTTYPTDNDHLQAISPAGFGANLRFIITQVNYDVTSHRAVVDSCHKMALIAKMNSNVRLGLTFNSVKCAATTGPDTIVCSIAQLRSCNLFNASPSEDPRD